MTTVITISESGRTDFSYDPKKCNRCGNCLEVCGFDVWELPVEGPAVVARLEACTNCTACAKNCLGGAITVMNLGCGCVWNQARKRQGDCPDTAVGPTQESSSSETGCCG
ncbi:MAG: ferredoxin family protein [Candidatus Thorarchaeota archaeon]